MFNLLLRNLVLFALILAVTMSLAACSPKSSKPIKQIEHAQGGSFAASVSYSGKYSVVSSLYHGVALWDLDKNGLKYIWQQTPKGSQLTFKDGQTTDSMASSNFVFATAISYDDSHVVLADKETFSLWQTKTGKNVGYWQARKSKVKLIKNPDDSYWHNRHKDKNNNTDLLDQQVIDANKCINPDSDAGEVCKILGRIRAVDVSNNGTYIVIGKSNGIVAHMNVDTGRRLEFLAHFTPMTDSAGNAIHVNNAINSLAISPNGHYVLTGSSDQTAYLWDTKTGQVVFKFRHGARVVQVALDPKGRYAFTSDSKGRSTIWDLKTGNPKAQLRYINRQEIFTTARFSANGKYLVTGAPNRELSLWSVKTGEKIQNWYVTPKKDSRPANAVVYSAAFTNNDQQIVTESSAGLNEVWEIKP